MDELEFVYLSRPTIRDEYYAKFRNRRRRRREAYMPRGSLAYTRVYAAQALSLMVHSGDRSPRVGKDVARSRHRRLKVPRAATTQVLLS